jgi:hypothetical protein
MSRYWYIPRAITHFGCTAHVSGSHKRLMDDMPDQQLQRRYPAPVHYYCQYPVGRRRADSQVYHRDAIFVLSALALEVVSTHTKDELRDHCVVCQLGINSDIAPSRQIMILDKVAQKSRILPCQTMPHIRPPSSPGKQTRPE